MKIIIFPRYDSSQAATRVRVLQYLPFLSEAGIDAAVFPVLSSGAISGRSGAFTFVRARLKSYFRVVKRLWKEKRKTNLINIHSELFPFVPFFIEYGYLRVLGINKYIIELDDAWFHRYDSHGSILVRLLLGNKIKQLMRHSTLVIAGNQYIAGYAKNAGAKHIEIVPTVVDVEKYRNFSKINKLSATVSLPDQGSENHVNFKNKPVIGWIGTPSTTKFLLTISSVIKLLNEREAADFVAIGANANQLKGLPVKVVKWSENSELETLYSFDIGIMPLTDSPFERGKCGYKLIQYMACGLPVVASPVGVNNDIVVQGVTGYFASSEDEWLKYLTILCNDKEMRNSFGKAGRSRAERSYNLKVTSPLLISIIKSAAS